MTVSNVLNHSGRVSEATRARVLAAVHELGYVPNAAAQRLGGFALARVGLLCPVVESVFMETALAACSLAAAEAGVQLTMRSCVATVPSEALAQAHQLVAVGAQALLLLPPFAELIGSLGGASGLGVPVAAIATADRIAEITTVRVDNRAASSAITERVVAAGRRRVAAIVGTRGHSDAVARLDGWRDALLAHHLPVHEDLIVEGNFRFEAGLVAASRLLDLDLPPDAIVAGNDDMAAAALWEANRRGVVVPDDLSVVGFDDTFVATRVWPQLTTVRQPIKEMSTKALELLAEALRDGGGWVPSDTMMPFRIVDRMSV